MRRENHELDLRPLNFGVILRQTSLLQELGEMPRYFFNLTNGIRTVVDADGVELTDEEATHLEATEMIADLRKESHITCTDWSGWRVVVYDENGCECFRMMF